MTELRFGGRCNQDDYREVMAALVGPARRKGLVVLALLALLPLAVAVIMVVRLVLEGQEVLRVDALLCPCLLVLMTPLFPLLFWVEEQQKAKGFAENAGHISGSASDDMIRLADEHSSVEHRWSAFKSYRSSAGAVALFRDPQGTVVFTRSLFPSEAEWQEFVSLVAAKLPRK
jgi:hypothetical protein